MTTCWIVWDSFSSLILETCLNEFRTATFNVLNGLHLDPLVQTQKKKLGFKINKTLKQNKK
jgi:hypothetical protein